MKKKISAGILGATGYAGAELVRILLRHPAVELAALGSVSFAGQTMGEVYPGFRGLCPIVCEDAGGVIAKSEVVFAALPHGLSQESAALCVEQGKKFIDIGADFRLEDPAEYERWYGCEARYPALHERAVYGLPELFRQQIAKTDIVGNPGCYPTSIALGLAPALMSGLVETAGIICDSKSGVSGAGRKPSQNTHFPDCNENFAAYKVAAHRHTPEIEQTLSGAAGSPVRITFVPHLMPVNRGILSTIYARLRPGVTQEQLRGVYAAQYQNERFIRLLPPGSEAAVRAVAGSNYCDIQLYTDQRTGTLIITSVIDNMIKGAAGQAVQNMNILFGLEESAGLDMIPMPF
ncbi:MAG: N-acetyl-gamma-glutamyl-phosphate reductase [Oscillospiraceae bacterium]|nr:N-acetyl-gamma-glutamyl-phosphate reductase [Oscillospiraceae bacterium]